jgi:hypothetical protein
MPTPCLADVLVPIIGDHAPPAEKTTGSSVVHVSPFKWGGTIMSEFLQWRVTESSIATFLRGGLGDEAAGKAKPRGK